MSYKFNSLFSGRNRAQLSTKEQNELFAVISKADTMEEAAVQFSKLYDSISPQIWNLLYKKYIPPLSVDDLKDVFQESWVKILESRKKFDSGYNVFNWIYVIKRNMVIDKIRKISRNRDIYVEDNHNSDDDDPMPGIQDLKSDDTPVDDALILSETVAIIKNSINEIEDEVEKEIMFRRLFNDEKLEFIANEMNIPLSTVYNYIKKSLNKLKPKINKLLNS